MSEPIEAWQQGELDFDSDPKKFPETWVSGEPTTSEETDAIINKHVYLALGEYFSDPCVSLHLSASELTIAVMPFDVVPEPGGASFSLDDMLEEFIEGYQCGDGVYEDPDGDLPRLADYFASVADRIRRELESAPKRHMKDITP
jgi:hypothetical protein